MHPFDQSITLRPGTNGRLTGESPKLYWNVVGPFGGATAAIALNAVLVDERLLGEPLVLTVNFTAPLREGGFDCLVRLTRTNRTTQHWHVELSQTAPGADPVVVVQAMIVTGVRRKLWGLQCLTRPTVKPVDQARRRDGRNGLVWFDRYDLRFFENPMKSQDPSDDTLSWVRDDPPRPLDYASLAALCDTLFPAIFAHRKAYMPIATVSMNVYFHVRAEQLHAHGDDYLVLAGRTQTHHEGFCDSEGELWAGDHLVATTQQVMWYKE